MDYAFPLRVACERFPRRTALVRGTRRVSFAELGERIDALAAGLARIGACDGARVASLMLNEVETVELYMALARAGAVSVPVNVRLTADEQAFILDDADVAVLVADPAFADRTAELAAHRGGLRVVSNLDALRDPLPAWETRVEDEHALAQILYTSGTTGFPKGVMRSHRANAWNVVNSALGSPRTRDDVELFTLPAFGIGFVHFALPALLAGATVVLDRAFDAERTWALLAEHRATRVFLAPTMIAAMLDVDGHERFDVSALEVVYCAYEFPERLRARALERFGDRFVYMYGLTEAQLTAGRLGTFAEDPTNVGHGMGLLRVKVLDDGEIALQGPSVMSGYLGRDDGLVDGWVHTGDLGRLDDDGELHYTGRKKEMIKSGGYNVDPVEVENAILTLGAVREAAVVGVPDEKWGEMVVAFVAGDAPPEAVIAACRARIAAFKTPKHVVPVDALPKNPTGKVERGRLRARWAELADRMTAP